MNILHINDSHAASAAMAHRIISILNEGKKVLWLVCGGSNIPITADALRIIRSAVTPSMLSNMTLGLTDERYGLVGHADSNWKQLQDAHCDFSRIEALPILSGLSLADTVTQYAKVLEKALANADVVVAQFGMGSDGHIAGILPHTPATSDTATVSAYESTPFTRVTITASVFAHIDIAYAIVYGAGKKEAVKRLINETLPFDEQPAQILKSIPEAYLYTDQD